MKCKISKKTLRELRDFELMGTGKMPKKLEKAQNKLVKCVLKDLKEKGEI